MKKIGIIGGISYESTKRYYELIHLKYYKYNRDYYFPEVIVYSLNFQKFTDLENTDRERYIEYILEGVRGLEAAGVNCIIMAANSPHSVYEQLVTETDIPFYSISDATLKKASELSLKKLLLLGIRHTMDAGFYPESGAAYNIDVLVPNEEEKNRINDIIFSELCQGKVTKHSKETLLRIISNYSVDGVILGCTELPMILTKNDVKIAVLDTVDIHIELMLQECM